MGLNGTVMLVSALVCALGFLWRNPLPPDADIVEPVRSDPRQEKVRTRGDQLTYRDVDYDIERVYRYDISGVVVSYRYHDDSSRLHRLANDHLNLLDVCLVWGSNAGNPALNKLDFWNGVFTCNVQTKDRDAWQQFDMNALSNNHLISADPSVRSRLDGLKVGDQVRLRGYLANYGAAGQPKRKSSTTREDTGNGACETLLVEDVEVLAASFSNWRLAMYVSGLVLLASLIRHFASPHRPHRRR
ncbi:MAG: hypothetical protein AAFX44_07205 [Pseudomonadota bacterium]